MGCTVIWRWCFFVAFLLPCLMVTAKQTYIVHMKEDQKPFPYATHRDWYSAYLRALTSADSDSILYAYTHACTGFAAWLDPEQAESLRRSDSVLAVYEDSVYTLHTTRTPEFLGLEPQIMNSLPAHTLQELDRASEDIIIGVMDSGIWPESKSFDDSGMPDVPSRWAGTCENSSDFSPSLCNKKLIGAKTFSSGYRMATAKYDNDSPRDTQGHGTHTASTLAGSHVANASLFGYAVGTARGIAARARVASYKVCWEAGCYRSDILDGINQAIDDGVDVLSISLGGGSTVPYFYDPIALGGIRAVSKGIFVSCSAGNDGPNPSTLSNAAPWLMTVGAGTLDRDFPADAVLGNGQRCRGVASLNSGRGMSQKQMGLVYINNDPNSKSNFCVPGSLKTELVRGKVVVCDEGGIDPVVKGAVVKEAGGVGMIEVRTGEYGELLVAYSNFIPAVGVRWNAGEEIKEYVKSHVNPTVSLSFQGTILNVRPAPVVADFSSRGPSRLSPKILKPDIIAPGVNILAAWSGAVGPTGANDTRRTKFNILSGTSMSCPHISGLGALLKAAHPEWSPSAIKSALMTTAYTRDNDHSPLLDATGYNLSNPFAYGSGHVDLQKALSPGLVYNISNGYAQFLCSLGYTLPQIQILVKISPNFTCSEKDELVDYGHLNYPSFSVLFNNSRVVSYTRELTNVDNAGSVYRVSVEGPSTVAVTVKPARLAFNKLGEKLSYTVTFVAKKGAAPVGGYAFGSLVWSDRQHQVKSPIAYTWIQP